VYWYHLSDREIMTHAFRQVSRGLITLRHAYDFRMNKLPEGTGAGSSGGTGPAGGEARAKPPPPPYPGRKSERPRPPPEYMPPGYDAPESTPPPPEPAPQGRPGNRPEEYPWKERKENPFRPHDVGPEGSRSSSSRQGSRPPKETAEQEPLPFPRLQRTHRLPTGNGLKNAAWSGVRTGCVTAARTCWSS
jgi:hypothetical protein